VREIKHTYAEYYVQACAMVVGEDKYSAHAEDDHQPESKGIASKYFTHAMANIPNIVNTTTRRMIDKECFMRLNVPQFRRRAMQIETMQLLSLKNVGKW
jgi:hypothetical protein